jgi:hypothetical protein
MLFLVLFFLLFLLLFPVSTLTHTSKKEKKEGNDGNIQMKMCVLGILVCWSANHTTSTALHLKTFFRLCPLCYFLDAFRCTSPSCFSICTSPPSLFIINNKTPSNLLKGILCLLFKSRQTLFRQSAIKKNNQPPLLHSHRFGNYSSLDVHTHSLSFPLLIVCCMFCVVL